MIEKHLIGDTVETPGYPHHTPHTLDREVGLPPGFYGSRKPNEVVPLLLYIPPRRTQNPHQQPARNPSSLRALD